MLFLPTILLLGAYFVDNKFNMHSVTVLLTNVRLDPVKYGGNALHWIDQLSLYLEVFSFKLRAAWSDHPENYILGEQNHNKHNLHVCILYINIIISYSFKERR